MARAAGFDNISLDLMMWLPQQTVAQWLESVDALIALGPEHASLYLLEIYPNAPLRDAMARGTVVASRPTTTRRRCTCRVWTGWTRRATCSTRSRTSRGPGAQSRHNLKYWSDGEWLGFGCGAHSTRGGVRWKNLSSTEEYISAVAARRSGSAPSGASCPPRSGSRRRSSRVCA